MTSYGICLFLSDLVHLAWSSLGPRENSELNQSFSNCRMNQKDTKGLLENTPRVSDLGGLGGAWESVHLTSSQVVLMLLIQGPCFEKHYYKQPIFSVQILSLETLLGWGGKRLELGLVAQEVRSCVAPKMYSATISGLHGPLATAPSPGDHEPSKAVGWAFTVSEYFLYSTDIHEGHSLPPVTSIITFVLPAIVRSSQQPSHLQNKKR